MLTVDAAVPVIVGGNWSSQASEGSGLFSSFALEADFLIHSNTIKKTLGRFMCFRSIRNLFMQILAKWESNLDAF